MNTAITFSARSRQVVSGPPSRSPGDTFEEARMNIQKAMELYLETLSKEEIAERLSHEVITSLPEVAIA